MRFHVYCTSDHDHRLKNAAPPCPGAFWDEEYRTVETSYVLGEAMLTSAAVEQQSRMRKAWVTEGENHRELNNTLIRERKIGGWALDVERVEELVALAEKSGRYLDDKEVIVGSLYGQPFIEIYDAYRE